MYLHMQNLGRWVGPSLKTITLHIYLNAFASILSCFVSIKLKTLSIQTPKVLLDIGIPYPKFWKSNFKKSVKTMFEVYSTISLSNQIMLCTLHHYRAPKHYTHIIFERRWNKKPNNAVKVVKGLPHMYPCHQLNPKKVSYVHEVNNNTTHLLSMSHNHVGHNNTFYINVYTQTTIE